MYEKSYLGNPPTVSFKVEGCRVEITLEKLKEHIKWLEDELKVSQAHLERLNNKG